MSKEKVRHRCEWVDPSDGLMVEYHDTEWGLPLHDDQKLFEALLLDLFQAGLSWRTILHKRENFRKAFDNFNSMKIAKYDEAKFNKLMQDVGIVRNRLKIRAAINNAQRYLAMQEECGSFSNYLWQFTGGEVIDGRVDSLETLRATSPESDAMSKQMKRDGFKFVGSTTLYAMMQGIGMVNDHEVKCFRYKEVKK